ncbi:winged helix-turn-helix domain-containing protein [Serratia sp. NA_112.1]|uniref:winged helix-turn-helix domain-containing protein n=1 Tax=unclassified Serratia (in: enterobacteria) TaxID=2647522 RepID=UPI004046C85C
MKYCFNIKIKTKSGIFILTQSKLIIDGGKQEVVLSKNQKKLFLCLLNDINDKKEIINKIWPNIDCKLADNNYSQLICRTRVLLSKNEFPPNVIVTIPRYGVCLNRRLVVEESLRHGGSISMLNDHAILLSKMPRDCK